jgi:hypothetical protein
MGNTPGERERTSISEKHGGTFSQFTSQPGLMVDTRFESVSVNGNQVIRFAHVV